MLFYNSKVADINWCGQSMHERGHRAVKKIIHGALLILAFMLSLVMLSVFVTADSASEVSAESAFSNQASESSTAAETKETQTQSTATVKATDTTASEYDDGLVGRVIFGVCVSLTVIMVGAVAIFVLSKLKHKIG